jgi:hypothetical protein
MKRDSMFKRFKQRLEASGPGVTLAVIAMVLALTGGAFAAAGKLTGPQKKEVEKIAKKIAKKVAKPGKPGAIGPAGPAGKDGANGTNGTNGKDGTNGKSVVVNSEPKGLNCKEGGASVEVSGEPATKKFACNGLEGKAGEEGSPWTAGGTLPPGATETGVWTFTGNVGDKKGIHVSLSFPIPLAENLGESRVHVWKDADFATNCQGGYVEPKATPGNLCVYISALESTDGTKFAGIFPVENFGERGASTMGALLFFEPPTSEEASGTGTFAVTGCGNAEFPCPTP